ncbi:MAG TPA: wax ester/triacylglycerol synthase family O-acyltransferase [Ramlibacter sp.]|nr:wax ester/triacylglycerol synthase family O-acyltransferase [Ramlibacter sp.]
MVTRIAAPQVARSAGTRARQTARAVQSQATRAATGILGLAGERMTKVDTAWLRMDSPSNLMVIVGVWALKPAVRYEDLCKRVEERLLKYSRFRQRVVEDAAGATWVEDSKFDITKQVVREKLPRHKKGGEQAALQERVGELAMQPLDRAHPLWQIHLVEDYEGGSALIFRIHHCIADGIALISVTMSLVDGGEPPPERRRKQSVGNPEEWIAQTLIKPFTDITVKALGAAGGGVAKSLELLQDPQQGLAGSLDMARIGMQVVSDAAAMLMMPDDSKTRLKGKPGRSKRVAWCPPVPVDEVKAVGKALNCSMNDVLLSCVAGAIGEYLRALGDDVTGQEIRAMVPVNLRPIDQAYKLGNRFGLVPLVLPIGIENPVERVYEVRRRMNALKGSTQPVLAFLVLAISGLLIKPAQDAIMGMFGRKTTAVMTNVPGPRNKLKFLGSTLEQQMFWVPQSGDIGLGVSILSYGGGVQFGVITDSTLCPQPQKIIDEFEPEFAKLSLVTLMLPWGD